MVDETQNLIRLSLLVWALRVEILGLIWKLVHLKKGISKVCLNGWLKQKIPFGGIERCLVAFGLMLMNGF